MNPTPLPNTPDDSALVLRMNAGDDGAFVQLYGRHSGWVFRMAQRITGEPQLADDVMQEVFCYFLGKFPGFVLRSALRTFLYPVVRNHALNALKKARRFDGGPAAEAHLQSLASPEPDAGAAGDFERMIAALGGDHREVLLLRFVDGMTVPEIAELTGVALGTVKSRLHHALAALRHTPMVVEMSGKIERSSAAECLTQQRP